MSAVTRQINAGATMNSGSNEAPSFSVELKEAGKDLHEQVENTPIIKSIFDRSIAEDEYMDYLACLFPIYDQLEKELALQENNPLVAPLLIPELFRAEAIKKDLSAFGDEERPPKEEAENYRTHLHSLGQYRPHLLISHVYLRYLGDLFGGMMIARRLQDKYAGKLNFYDFDALCAVKQLRSPTAFASQFRQILDELPLTCQQRSEVLEEVCLGYRMHFDLFMQLKN